MAADGSIIIDTRIDTRGFKAGTTNMKTQFGKLSGIIGKLGAAIGAAFAVRTLINFGKEALELGSDLQEVQNVVDVTFTTMSDRVNEFAQNMATAAGLSETMAKRYVGTYGAMSKSFGFAEAEAYEMSTTLTKLTGDVASFYNITQDMAYTKLKSVFTGETESLKDLGVVMTQSALDAYALANGFGKTTSAMTEQEKVALRYRFVLDQLSAASGDFIRTADGWANQTRILKLQFDSLKASIGQGLINILTPVLKVINTLLAKLNTLAASFKSFTEMLTGKKSSGMASGYKDAAQSAESLATATTGVADATKEAAKAAEGYLSPLDEINKISAPEDPSSSGGGAGASVDYGSLEEGQSIIDRTTESLDKLQSMFNPLKEAWAEYGGSITQSLKNIGTDVVETGKEVAKSTVGWFSNLNWKPIFASFDGVLKALQPLTDLITDTFAWAYENILLPFGKWAVEDAFPASLEFLKAKIERLTDRLQILADICIWFYDHVLRDLLAVIGDVVVGGIDILTGFVEFADGIFSADLEKIFSGLSKMLKGFKDICSSIFSYIQNNIVSPFTRFMSGTFLNNWRQIWNSVIGFVRTPINSIIGMINTMIGAVVEGINSAISALNGINVRVPSWVPYYGGRSFGFDLGYIHAPRIPYLATGAVIPPNAPFMAMLGDQRHGNNIEAPESLIRKIVREESGGVGKGYTFVGQINRRVLFEEFITEAKLRQQTTGRNPFEFA